jgi:hypothetical protein
MKASNSKGRGRVVYVETDTMRNGTRRRTVVTSRPKKGYSDITTYTGKSGNVVTTANGKVAKISVKSKGKTSSSRRSKAK